MADKINGRTPEEIKKRLERCIKLTVCAGCPYSEKKGCDNVLFVDALDLIQQLERECDAAVNAQPKWISVEERLPEKWHGNDAEQTLVNYQIYSPRYGVDIGNYVKPAGRWVIMGLPVDKVTHWMPLPEPPEVHSK